MRLYVRTYGLQPSQCMQQSAAVHRVVLALRHLAQQFPALKESTVRTWRNLYTTEPKKRAQLEDNNDSKSIKLLYTAQLNYNFTHA